MHYLQNSSLIITGRIVTNMTKRISNLKARRLEKKLTQKQLAKQFNDYIDKLHLDVKHTSYTTISRWESLVIEPRETVINILANVLGTYPDRIRGYELTTREKELEVEKLLGKLFIPYRNASSDEELKDFYDDYFYDDFESLLDTYVNSSDTFDWYKFDVTSSLLEYLNTLYPQNAKSLDENVENLFKKIEDQDKLLEAASKILPKYLEPFINKLTSDLDENFHITHDHWYSPNTISFLTKWFTEQKEIELNKRHPEYKMLKDFYRKQIFSPLMNLQSYFDPNYSNEFTSNKLNTKDLYKEVDTIKKALDTYASLLDKYRH